jgi:putative phosphoesterase
VRVLVLADTHLRPGRARALPAEIEEELTRCDAVLHAGDVVTRHLLDHLGAHVPVHAVLGNNDGELRGTLPERLDLDLAGVRAVLVHETGAAKGRGARLRRRFPDADVVVFGHSHIPLAEEHDGLLLFNPGSAVDRRRQPQRTYGVLDLADGRVRRHEIIAVP